MNAWTGFLAATLLLLVFTSTGNSGSLVYKNYIVRYDRGWDILCEPYVVQPNDWVLKIFRQKGEIAHQDFREFLGIFQRLNPHVKDIDMVQPGQTIDIPLRKLEHGSLPGQASGVVTIPFVTLSKVTEVIKQHSDAYQVQRGDTVSQLIARRYGKFGTTAYTEGVKLFQAVNPQVTDLNVIYAGQKVYMPDPGMRDKAWYSAMYDEHGNLRETVAPKVAPEAPPASPPPPAVNLPAPQASAKTPAGQDSLSRAAGIVGGTFRDKGTYYLPRANAEDFELDLSRYPMLDLGEKGKMLFTKDTRIMGMDIQEIEKTWPDIHIVTADDQSSVEEILAAVFDKLTAEEDRTQASDLAFSNQGVQVTVRAKWIKSGADQRSVAITPLTDPGEFTPESMRRYLDQNGIVIKEVLPDGKTNTDRTAEPQTQRHAVKNILDLAPTDQKDFVRNLARALGFSYSPNVSITFPYAGIQVKAYANLLSAGSGHEVLVDYGDLYGDALSAIAKSGPGIVQIGADDTYTLIAKRLLSALGLDFVENPTFLAARRPAAYNTAVTVAGLLYAKDNQKKILLSPAALPPAVTDMLSAAAVDVVLW
jgi:LysM domain